MTKLRVTSKEFTIAVILAFMGFVFSTRQFLLWLDAMNPLQGLIVYYVILYSSLYALSRMGLTVFGFKISKVSQSLGLLIITFAFFVTVNFSSAWTTIATGGNPNAVSTIYYQDEDGVLFWLWSQMVPNVDLCRIMTYVVSPFILTLLGTLLVSGRIKIKA
jgi:hypothetical protein